MQIVIDISENIYNLIARGEESCDFVYKSDLMRAILEGTPLVGKRLINADKFIDSLKGIERLHIDDELRNNILNALYTNILETESEVSDADSN